MVDQSSFSVLVFSFNKTLSSLSSSTLRRVGIVSKRNTSIQEGASRNEKKGMNIPRETERWCHEAARQKRAARTARRENSTVAGISEPPLRPDHLIYTLIGIDASLSPDVVQWWAPYERFRPEEWHPESELFINELWKSDITAIIDHRIAQFRNNTEKAHSRISPLAKGERIAGALPVTPRVFEITELLEAILGHANSHTQLTARNVSSKWRAVAEQVISMRNKIDGLSESTSSMPVEYGDDVDRSIPYLHISEDESDQFDQQLAIAQDSLYNVDDLEDSTIYFPARLTQAPNLSDDMDIRVQIFREHHEDEVKLGARNEMRQLRKAGWEDEAESRRCLFGPNHPRLRPGPHVMEWKDFSQFKFNPYFLALFGDSCTFPLGRCDIRLTPGIRECQLVSEDLISKGLSKSIGSMFVTEPPCKTMGLYMWEPVWSAGVHAKLVLLGKVCNGDGIRVDMLLRALHQHTEIATTSWIQQAEQLQRWVAAGHWKYDVWIVPGAPRICILLSNPEILDTIVQRQPLSAVFKNRISHTHDHQWISVTNRERRIDRQGEWMPEEMMKPQRSSSPYSPILPGIYAIGLNGPFFKDDNTGRTLTLRQQKHSKVFERIRRHLELFSWVSGNYWSEIPGWYHNVLNGLEI